MKLQYKISIIMMIVSLSVLSSISYIYSDMSYKSVIDYERKKLMASAVDSAKFIEHSLLDKLSNARTLASAPIVVNSLKNSNLQYEDFSDKQKNEYISSLNKKWMSSSGEEDTFVKEYMNNELALYLKKQQSVLKGTYGELFITNVHGAMIATTGKLTTLAHSHKYWFKEAYANGDGKFFFDDRGFDKSVGGYVIGVVVPIKHDSKIIGILKANVNIMGSLSDVIDDYDSGNHGSLKIVRSKGKIVYAKGLTPLAKNIDKELLHGLENKQTESIILKDDIAAYSPLRISIDYKDIIFGGKGATIDHKYGNDGEIWHAVIYYDKETALLESKETNKIIIIIGLAITILSAVFAYFIGIWISRPIEKLQAETQKRLEAQEKQKKQEDIMIAQSRHAAMGEMINMLAHQWRQPMSAISMGVNNILADIELEMIDEKTLKETSEKILLKTKELSKTIDDFRGFFTEELESQNVTISEVVNDALNIIEKSFENNSIELIQDIKSEKTINTYPKELMQVVINILKNSKEAIVENKTATKQIKISAFDKDNDVVVQICDTGGGIEDDIIDRIFEPYFTTKGVESGQGLGLYMSKTIVEKHIHGRIECFNREEGVCFELYIPLSDMGR